MPYEVIGKNVYKRKISEVLCFERVDIGTKPSHMPCEGVYGLFCDFFRVGLIYPVLRDNSVTQFVTLHSRFLVLPTNSLIPYFLTTYNAVKCADAVILAFVLDLLLLFPFFCVSGYDYIPKVPSVGKFVVRLPIGAATPSIPFIDCFTSFGMCSF